MAAEEESRRKDSHWIHTEVTPKTWEIFWSLDIDQYLPTLGGLRSPPFCRRKDDGLEWQIEMDATQAYFGLYSANIILKGNRSVATKVVLSASVYENSNGETKCRQAEVTRILEPSRATSCVLVRDMKIEEFAKDARLEFRVRMAYVLRSDYYESQQVGGQSKSRDQTSFLNKLLDEGLYSDMKILVEEREFAVHKSILATKSEYFQTLFSHDTIETREKTIAITDFNAEVIEIVLKFIYSGKIFFELTTFDYIEEILRAADKYLLLDLKEICAEMMSRFIYQGKVMQVFKLALEYNSPGLKDSALRYIFRNRDEFLSDWMGLLESDQQLMTEISESFRSKGIKLKEMLAE